MISKTFLRFGLFDDTNVSHSSSHQPMIIVDKVLPVVLNTSTAHTSFSY